MVSEYIINAIVAVVGFIVGNYYQKTAREMEEEEKTKAKGSHHA